MGHPACAGEPGKSFYHFQLARHSETPTARVLESWILLKMAADFGVNYMMPVLQACRILMLGGPGGFQ